MSMSAGLARLQWAAKDLRARWGEVKTAWHDENARKFEEKHLAPLLARLRATETAMSNMATILQKVRRDCE